MVVDLYSGFEGEPEIVFSCQESVVRTWDGFFDEIMREVKPSADGWVGFALHYNLVTGWREDDHWDDSDPADTLRQLEQVMGLRERAEVLRTALIALYREAVGKGGTVTIREE